MLGLIKPEYVFNPIQAVRRLVYAFRRGQTRARTPWGLEIAFDPAELHGRAMLTLGLSDLRTCELISRIVRPGDMCVDIGANIGIMTSLMAKRAGRSGRVHAFEPHPVTRRLIEKNAGSWSGSSDVADVLVHALALSDIRSERVLVEPKGFSSNSGLASLEILRAPEGAEAAGNKVNCIAFDNFFDDDNVFQLVKIDVEGHEDKVLEGMRCALSGRRVQSIIFEEMRALPSPACDMLAEFGYKTYLIDRDFWGPRLVPTEEKPPTLTGEATNVLAVLDPRAIGIPFRPGWTCLRS